jgi:hypothetical protein
MNDGKPAEKEAWMKLPPGGSTLRELEISRSNLAMTTDSGYEPDLSIIAPSRDRGAPMDEFGFPVRPPSKVTGYLVAGGCLAGPALAAWMTVTAELHQAEPQLWYLGVLAGLSPLALWNLSLRKIQAHQTGLRRLVRAACLVGIICAIILPGIGPGTDCGAC